MANKNQIREQITNTIIAALERLAGSSDRCRFVIRSTISPLALSMTQPQAVSPRPESSR
jgi:hypothetical protein